MYLIGIRIFEIVYKVPLVPFSAEFMIAGVGSGILCIATVYSNLLVLIRETKILLISYMITAAVSAGTSIYLVVENGLFGAAVSYLVTTVLLMLLLAAGFIYSDLYKNDNSKSIERI